MRGRRCKKEKKKKKKIRIEYIAKDFDLFEKHISNLNFRVGSFIK